MLKPEQAQAALSNLFQRQRVADLNVLCRVLGTQSRMTVVRRLNLVGYLTSYNHNGRYYTLSTQPEFDADGLWRFQGICFSRHGSLKATIQYLVQAADAGFTYHELFLRLQVRLQTVLIELVRVRQVGREKIGAVYVYVSSDQKQASVQVEHRRILVAAASVPRTAALKPVLVIEVLVEIIRGTKSIPDPTLLCERLEARSVTVTVPQIEGIYEAYRLKKTGR